MTLGKANRLSRIFRPDDGMSVMLALDHGMALGPIKGIEKPADTIAPLAPFVDALMATKGVIARAFEPDGRVGVVLRASGAATIAGPDLTNEGLTATVEEAIRLSADAVATSIFVGTPNERETIENLAHLAGECSRYDIPVLAVTAVGKDREKQFDAKYLALACRVATEHGADLVKTYFTPEGFDSVVETCGVPIIIAGGPKLETEVDVLRLAKAAVGQGAKGIDMGRNVWQSPNPVLMVRALRAIIHEGATTEQATEILGEVI
ncbi:MAG: 3-hydroxy-5-phosphonooxypentane-2,4-dione thiolase [Firmicutes bacterium]|jgi:putative autoinducer-2 (AI-2) aldolase|nr:3-hydroxy-5-phosphonooxypentane-2,4-dione thiolase [Bacillota bacterium]